MRDEKESGVLGDIVPNNTNPTNTAAAVKTGPLPKPEAGGYGMSSFGPAKSTPATPRTTVSAQFQPQPAARLTAKPAAPVVEKASVKPLPEVELASKAVRGRAPFVLTIVGVMVFIGGVSGLFIYALN